MNQLIWTLLLTAMKSTCVVDCQLSGDLRILSTSQTNKGRLEIYYNGEWGTICHTRFDHVDAAVACRQLGYCSGQMIPSRYVDDGNGTIWLDDINCSGSENKLINCTYSIDASHCPHSYDVGIHCYLSCPTEEDEGLLNLITGSTENKGRLEIYYKGEWGTICHTRFDHVDGAVACRQLGYCSGQMIPSQYVDDGNGTIWLNDINCSGSENKLINCTYSIDASHCLHSYDVGLHCYLSCPAEEDEGLLRLVTGSTENKGRLEINYKGEWGTICHTRFDHVDAAVACRQLGYCSGKTIPSNLVDAGQGTIWFNNVDCSGSENKLINCTYSIDTSHCSHWHDVSIDCFKCATEDEDLPVVQINPSNYTATYGREVVITCNIVSASPAATQVYWQRSSNNQNLRIDNGDQGYQGSTTSTPSLTINFATKADAGVYTCFVTNMVGTSGSNLGTVTITGGLLSVFVTPQNQNVLQGNKHRISCTVSGTPSAQNIAWLFTASGSPQQIQLNTTNSQKYTIGTTQDPFLMVLDFQPSDAGTYVCRATNAAGSTSSNPGSTLTYISDLDITVSRMTYSVIAGDSIVTIMCKINGTPPAIAWDWTKTSIAGGNSEIISQGTNNARRQVIDSATKPNLNIYSITEDDKGIYRCRANNGEQQYISDPIVLKVLEASLRKVPGDPQINNALEVEEGRTVILTCSSSGGNPAPTVVWLKDSNLISTGTNSSIFGNATTTTLTFVTTAYDNLEVYECQSDNGFLQRPLVKTTYLLFSPSNKPPGQPIITGSQRYDLGDTVTLSCSSTGGNPLPTVNWLRDDNVLTTGISRFSSSELTRTTLTFVAGLEDHLKVFECQAHNDYLQNPLVSTTYIELYFAPRVPTLTGPSTLISGSSGKWTCSAANGYPAPTLSMRIQDRQYTNEITVLQSYDIIDKSYTVAGTLNLVPSIDKTGQDLCCDVIYLFGNNDPQSTCLQLTINDEDEDNIIIYVVIGILATLVLFVLLVVMIRYRIGRKKGKGHANSKYVSQQAAFSNQQDTTDNSTHQDRDRDYEGLDSNRREMHVYKTSQDNVEYSHYSTIPVDHVFMDPNHTHPSILKQNSTNLQQDTTYLEPEHSILTPDNAYFEPDQTYFQPISGNSMTSTT